MGAEWRWGRTRSTAAALWLSASLFIVGCGGGGGNSTPTTTPLPQALSIATTTAEAGAERRLVSSLATPSPASGLTLKWDFGDGSAASSEPSPSHRYVSAGDYRVRLTVTNEAGQSVSAEQVVKVRRTAWVAGMACTGADDAGWCRAVSGYVDARAPRFFSATAMFRITPSGTLLGTDDDGRSWVARMPAPDAALTDLHQPDALNAWMVWTNAAGVATISRTRDGGRSWTTLRVLAPATDTTDTYRLRGNGTQQLIVHLEPRSCTEAVDLNDFLSNCFARQIEWSSDAGATWRSVASELRLRPPSMELTPSGTLTYIGCAASGLGGSCRQEAVLSAYLLESGSIVSAPVDDRELATQARAGNTLLVLQRPSSLATSTDWVLWRSDDGGRHWTPIVLKADTDVVAQVGPPIRLAVLERRCGTSAACELLEVSGYADGRRYVSIDGGRTWTRAAPVAGWRVGVLDAVLLDREGSRVSSDGGVTWHPLPQGRALFVSEPLQVTADGTLWYVSQPAAAGPAHHYRSVDGGVSWQRVWSASAGYIEHGLAGVWRFADGRLIAANGRGVGVAPHDGAQESVDGGSTWQTLAGFAQGVDRLMFFDARVGYVWGPEGILVTADGGRSWTQDGPVRFDALAQPQVVDLQLLADGSGWSIASGRLWRRSAAPGATWQQAEPLPDGVATYGRIHFVDATHGYLLLTPDVAANGASGSTLHRTDDAGRTWQPVTLPAGAKLNALFFVDAQVGWLVGAQGLILATVDGGSTWVQQPSGTRADLWSVGAVDRWSVWAGGDGGTLLFSATGGR